MNGKIICSRGPPGAKPIGQNQPQITLLTQCDYVISYKNQETLAVTDFKHMVASWTGNYLVVLRFEDSAFCPAWFEPLLRQ